MNFRERDRMIYERRQRGDTLQAIGDWYSLTRERVRQICAREVRRLAAQKRRAEGIGDNS